MTSFSGSYKTQIDNSLKQVKSQKAQRARVQKNSMKTQHQGLSLFRIGYITRNCNKHHKHKPRQAVEEC